MSSSTSSTAIRWSVMSYTASRSHDSYSVRSRSSAISAGPNVTAGAFINNHLPANNAVQPWSITFRVIVWASVASCRVGKMSAFRPFRGDPTQRWDSESARLQVEGGAPGRNRTCDTRFRKPVLYPLSYEGIVPICRYFVFLRPGKNTTSC